MTSHVTKILPVITERSQHLFVDLTKYPKKPIEGAPEGTFTAPLAVNVAIDLLGVSTTAELLDAGEISQCDCLDPSIRLQTVVVQVGEELLELDVGEMPTSTFTMASTDFAREMVLQFKNWVLVDAATPVMTIRGGPLSEALKLLNTYMLRFELVGEANVELGTVKVVPGPISSCLAGWTETFAEEPSVVLKNTETKKAAEEVLGAAKVVGYTLAEVLNYKSEDDLQSRAIPSVGFGR